MVPDFTAKTIWNMDEARMRVLNQYLVMCEMSFLDWDLDNLYIQLVSIRRIISGKISKEEYDKAGEKLEEIEKLKKQMDIDKEKDYDKKRVEWYNICDQLYVMLNRFMKKHGLFFREGDDPTRAALKR